MHIFIFKNVQNIELLQTLNRDIAEIAVINKIICHVFSIFILTQTTCIQSESLLKVTKK